MRSAITATAGTKTRRAVEFGLSRVGAAVTPNPRLQRTRSALLRSPLSRKPLGAAKELR